MTDEQHDDFGDFGDFGDFEENELTLFVTLNYPNDVKTNKFYLETFFL